MSGNAARLPDKMEALLFPTYSVQTMVMPKTRMPRLSL